jgi:cytochrome c oxidase subunit II
MNWFTQWVMPAQGSTLAPSIDTLFWTITVIDTLFFLLIAGLIAVFVKRYRRRGPDEITPHITHHQKLEIIWSVVPLFIVMGIFFWGFHGFMRAQIAPANSIEIQVRAKKWVWEFEYPDGMRSLNSFHVPVNRPVRLVMNSEDVIHSFFVPTFRVKMDVLPRRYTELWFEPTQVGVHQVFCTEYCGKGHSDMLARVHVDDEPTYQKWLVEGDEELKTMPLPDLGKLTYENAGCATCHSLDGSRGQGPSWKGVFGSTRTFADGTTGVADENYIRQSVYEPNAKVVQGFEPVMPTFKGLVRDRQVLGVIEYMKQLK